jgi:hypothetical protein
MLFPHTADVACAVRRRPDHRLTEDSNTFPGQAVACGGQLATGHWVAVVIMAAFLRIPRMCASGADDQLSHSQQTIKILHFDPRWSRSDRVLARSMRTPTECLKRAIEQLALLAGTAASSAPILVVKSPKVALSSPSGHDAKVSHGDGFFEGVQTTPQLLSRPLPVTRRPAPLNSPHNRTRWLAKEQFIQSLPESLGLLAQDGVM